MDLQLVHEPTVNYVDKLGTDLTVVNAARVSFSKHRDEFQQDDVKLLEYLSKHDHWSPFAHAQLQLRITAPIFVARQLVKHQIGLVWNEESRRYITERPTFYMPTVWRGKPTQGAKQGSAGEILLPAWLISRAEQHMQEAERLYDLYIENGVAPEQARMWLTLNSMTSWYWTGSLYAIARVCKLRLDPHAQGETRDVALLMWLVAAEQFPEAWRALDRHFIGSPGGYTGANNANA
jgi:thymidylate synthase (FAD)